MSTENERAQAASRNYEGVCQGTYEPTIDLVVRDSIDDDPEHLGQVISALEQAYPGVPVMVYDQYPATDYGDGEEVCEHPIRHHVLAFHERMGVPVASVPSIPPDDRVRLRLRLITEEYFELLEACGLNIPFTRGFVLEGIEAFMPSINLPELADACADLDYVVEGTRLECGINGGPIADEVQRSNMAKLGGAMREDGKILKPDGWTPPDIAGELRKQGWEG